MTALPAKRKRRMTARERVLRVFPSGSWHNHAPHWCGYSFSGVGSGFVTLSGIPMLVTEAMSRAARNLKGRGK